MEKIKIWDIWNKYSVENFDEEDFEGKEEIVNMIKQNLERKMNN